MTPHVHVKHGAASMESGHNGRNQVCGCGDDAWVVHASMESGHNGRNQRCGSDAERMRLTASMESGHNGRNQRKWLTCPEMTLLCLN